MAMLNNQRVYIYIYSYLSDMSVGFPTFLSFFWAASGQRRLLRLLQLLRLRFRRAQGLGWRQLHRWIQMRGRLGLRYAGSWDSWDCNNLGMKQIHQIWDDLWWIPLFCKSSQIGGTTCRSNRFKCAGFYYSHMEKRHETIMMNTITKYGLVLQQ